MECCFPDCWRVSLVVPVFKNVGERSAAKNYQPVSLLSVVSKVFEKLVNNMIVDDLGKCGLFSDFQYSFRCSRSTADHLTVVSGRIPRAFNRSGVKSTRTVALDISKAFDRIWHAGLLHKLKSYGISGQIFGLISSFLSNRWLRVVLGRKSSEEYPVNAGVPQGSILGPALATSLEPLAHRRNVASLSLSYKYYFGRCSSELAHLVPLLLILEGGLLVILIDCMILLSPFLDVTVSFLAQLDSGILCL